MRSLALLLVALAGLIAFEGCGSDSDNGKKTVPVNSCSPSYCPPIGAMQGCCTATNVCGVMANGGCVPTAKMDAGAH